LSLIRNSGFEYITDTNGNRIFKNVNEKETQQTFLGTLETAFWTTVWASEFSAAVASPYHDFSTVWTWKLGGFGSRRYYSVTGGANWHCNCDCGFFAHGESLHGGFE